MKDTKYLLLQIRNPDDPIREHEVECFARALECPASRIIQHDLIRSCPDQNLTNGIDAVLIGGSGDYSVVDGGDWFEEAMKFFRELCAQGKPTFASCWGFQAFALALGGKVVTDLERAEVGTLEFRLTESGKNDPVFSPLGSPFLAQIGHQDIVVELPDSVELLASTEKVSNQGFVVKGKPIYATQFHPELELMDLIQRLEAYPEYVKKITGLEMLDFVATCRQTPGVTAMLARFRDSFVH